MVCGNLFSQQQRSGADMRGMVKAAVYPANIADFAAMNEVCAGFFGEPYPDRAAFEVACLPKKCTG